MESVEAEGRSVNEATEKALEELGLHKDQVDVEVLSEGRPRLLGFRGEPARVRVTAKPVAAPAPRPVREPVAGEAEPVDEEEFDEDEEFEEDEELEEDEEFEDDEDVEPVPTAVREPPRPEREPVPEASSEDVEAAARVLGDLVRLMGIDAEVSSRPRSPPAMASA